MLIFFSFLGALGVIAGASICVNLIASPLIFLGLPVSDLVFCVIISSTPGSDLGGSSSATTISLPASVFFFSLVSLTEASFSFFDKASFSSLRDVFIFLRKAFQMYWML